MSSNAHSDRLVFFQNSNLEFSRLARWQFIGGQISNKKSYAAEDACSHRYKSKN